MTEPDDDIEARVAAFAAELEDDTAVHPERNYSPAARIMSPDHTNGGDVECWIVNCMECGAAIFLDPRDEIMSAKIHSAWHDKAA